MTVGLSTSATNATGHPEVVLSTTCFGERNLESLCQRALAAGVDRLELSGNVSPMTEDALRAVFDRYRGRLRFYVHNYFPPPFEPFVLNLAHPDTAERSVAHCRRAIDLCRDLGCKHYSLHAGLATSPLPRDLGRKQTHLETIDMARSRRILFSTAIEVADYGAERGVSLLLENNVVAGFNCPTGVNDRYHLADMIESEELLPLFEHPNIGMLLDTGHLKASAHALGFDPVAFVERFRRHICVVQISDNDGTADQNRPVTTASWFWPHLPWAQVDYVSLEVSGLNADELVSQIALTRTRITDELHAQN